MRAAAPRPVVDGLEPGAVACPDTPEALAEVLAEAAREGRAVVPWGGGRAQGMGNPLKRFDVCLLTTGLNRILEHRQHDLTLTVEAGARLENVQEELGRAGQFLPLDPFGSPGHTVGGLLAAGWSGPLRLRFAAPRDYLLGLRVALPDGTLVRSGGKVVKNVSGYDLNKLHVGALGTLGVIVEATFKVQPLPFADRSVRLEVREPGEAWQQAAAALSLPLPPAALLLVAEEDQRFFVDARFLGAGAAVERMVLALGWPEADQQIWSEHGRRRSATWARISVPPGVTAELAAGLDPPWVGMPGLGVVHWFVARSAAGVTAVRERAAAAGGGLVLLAAPPDLKRQAGAWGLPPPGGDVMRALRQAFDPRGVLAPGRFLL